MPAHRACYRRASGSVRKTGSATRQQQVEPLFEIEGEAVFEGDVAEAADILAGGRTVGRRLTFGDDLGVSLDRKRAETAVIEKDDLAVFVGNEVGQ